MHQLKDRHGLIAVLVLSLTVYLQLPLLALDSMQASFQYKPPYKANVVNVTAQ